MAPEEKPPLAIERLIIRLPMYACLFACLLGAAAIAGALGWFFWATWPYILANLLPYVITWLVAVLFAKRR